MIAVEDGQLPGVFRRPPGQERVLLRPAAHIGDPDGRARPVGRAHALVGPAGVPPDEGIGPLHDAPRGAVVGLQQESHPLGPGLPEPGEGLGIGGAEAIDGLILVPHQKEIAALLGQQADDLVLDAGGILGLVHHEILEPGPPGRHYPGDHGSIRRGESPGGAEEQGA